MSEELFKLDPEPSFWAPVEILMPGGKVGKFSIEYHYRDRNAYVELLKQAETMDDIDVLMLAIKGWKGPDAAFSRETLARLLRNYPGATRVIFRTYRSNLLGEAEKN